MALTVAQWLKHAALELNAHNSARLEADLILCHVLHWDRTALYAHPEQPLDGNQLTSLNTLLQRRLQGEPIAYLVEQREFWSLPFHVNKNVLVPRPETELMVELAINFLKQQQPDKTCSVVDAGTGSGAIAVALSVVWTRLSRYPLNITASDQSQAALDVARQNGQTHCPDTIQFVHSDWFAAFEDDSFDLVLSNPPYLSEQDPHLDGNNLAFEPLDALVSGDDGLDAIRTIVSQAIDAGKPGAWVVLEHGATQAAQVTQLMQAAGYTQVQTHQDLAGLDRITSGYCPEY